MVSIYEEMIQRSLSYVEQHLYENPSLDDLARETGFSKYHFHRMFKKYVGKNISQYIRSRKMACAVDLLLYTDERVLDIALLTGFESHEAFTRAFGKIYGLTPSKYREQMRVFIKQKGDEKLNKIKGWLFTGTTPEKYSCELDKKVFINSNCSVTLRANEGETFHDNDFGTLMQQFQAADFLGKRVRFSGFVKSENITGWSGLWMRIDDKSENILGFDNMEPRCIKGTTEWNHYACVLDVPEEANRINIGILLSGFGQVWLSSCSFEEVGKDIPVTDSLAAADKYPRQPQNLNFSD
ncbi:putative HTH-type transcriptional regulator YbfP [Paenibacillus faecis]|nr:putative HTH-type transcriptional regulator YbfP [Paenibacillus faecis]